jgi:phage/plasmid primase-like uncharacterized protein
MGYMTFKQQVASHLRFLQEAGLQVANLEIDSVDFIRSHAEGQIGRGEYAYKTETRRLDNGMTGLITWCRSKSGKVSGHKTYGHGSSSCFINNGERELIQQPRREKEEISEKNLRRIQKFWEMSYPEGESDYLKRKGVKAYRIRFRENFYGKVAIIPMRNINGQLRGYQILNADGSKVFAKGIPINGLFHYFSDLIDNVAIGMAESYVTAATCYELLPMPMITAFTSDNMAHVAAVLRRHYPNSPLVIFADNDKHLVENKGILAAKKALREAQGNGIILTPQFRNGLKTRDYSDWNDLVREIGPSAASEQMWKVMQKTENDKIKTFYF